MTIELLAEKDVLKKQIAELQLALDRANEKFCYLGFPEYSYDIDYGRDMIRGFAESIVYEHYYDLKNQIEKIHKCLKGNTEYLNGFKDALDGVKEIIIRWEEEHD